MPTLLNPLGQRVYLVVTDLRSTSLETEDHCVYLSTGISTITIKATGTFMVS